MQLKLTGLFFLFNVFHGVAFSQRSYEITYRMGCIDAPGDSAVTTPFKIKLLFNDTIAFSTNISKDENLFKQFEKIGKKVILEHTFISYIKKDAVFNLLRWPEVKKNCFVFRLPYYNNWVIDTVSSFTILNYSCQQAYTVLASGDTAFVWFTCELPGKFGPLFFNGLPGIILATYEQPNGRCYLAEAVEIVNYNLLLPAGSAIFTKNEYDEKIRNR